MRGKTVVLFMLFIISVPEFHTARKAYLRLPLHDAALHIRICHRLLSVISQPEMASRLRSHAQNPKLVPEVCPAAFQHSLCSNVSGALMALEKERTCSESGRSYTQECTCAICKGLFQVAVALPRSPEEVFKQRLRLYCNSLEFLDPPCLMIADEYDGKIYEMSANDKQTDLQNCKILTLCN